MESYEWQHTHSNGKILLGFKVQVWQVVGQFQADGTILSHWQIETK